MNRLHPETICLYGGYTPRNGEPRQIPIIQSTTYKYDTSEAMGKLFDLEAEGYFYTRLQNPTNDAVAARITALEGGVAGMLTASGQAANLYAIVNLCGEGDHVVSSTAVYGGTFNLFDVTLRRLGIDFTFVNPDCGEDELAAKERYAVIVEKNTATETSTAQDTSVLLLDAEPTFHALLDDLAAGVPASVISRRFHDAMVGAIVMSAELVRAMYDISTVALSGGVFMNRYLVEHALADLAAAGFTVAINRDLPPNDGCISLGQAVVASARSGE